MSALSVRKTFSSLIYSLILFLMTQQSAYASPLITNIEIRNIGYTSVTIAWKTDIATNSQISYGETSVDAYKSHPSHLYDTDHSVTLTNLRPATKYMFVVTSATEEGVLVSGDIEEFSTLSFRFEDDIGSFGSLNVSPTPTPYINPYAQYPAQTTIPNYVNQQPLYIVPPVVYQQAQATTGQTLGETTTQQIPQTTETPDSLIISLIQSSIWGVVILFGILIVVLVLLFNQLMKNKKELHELQQQMFKAGTTNQSPHKEEEPEKKVYRFDVRS